MNLNSSKQNTTLHEIPCCGFHHHHSPQQYLRGFYITFTRNEDETVEIDDEEVWLRPSVEALWGFLL